MIGVLARIAGWLSQSALDRVLDTVDKKVEAGQDRERIKAEIAAAHLQTRAGWMRAGGFWLLCAFSVPVLYWLTAVIIYSVHWCADCHNPKDWTIAALPSPIDEWAGLIVLAAIGGLSLMQVFGRK